MMHNQSNRIGAAALAVAILALGIVRAQQPAPLLPLPLAPGGLSLVIPESDKAKGTAFYALTQRDRQLYLESNAPLENIKGQSNGIVGYAMAGNIAAGEPAIWASEFQVPVTAIKTGIDLRDEHMASSDWLDAGKYPMIAFRCEKVEGFKEEQATEAFTRYSGTFVGRLTLHGVTRDIKIPGASVVVMKASDRTAKIAKGDLVAVRANFSVVLADYGISHPIIGDRVAKNVDLQVSVYLSSIPPERQ